jgi:hypothetical protein|tara:strand:- start:2934 stop:4049 length:1116 start_codon:yes stop_codon:yes gene_type:complete
MASKFSTKLEKTVTKDFVFETLNVTASVISGTYTAPGTTTSNMKNAASELYQSVFDYPYLSQSANQVFDITFGYRENGTTIDNEFYPAVTGTTNDSDAKANIYNQMAAIMLGYDQTGSVRVFDVSGNFNSVNTESVMDAPFFIDLSRLAQKDELKKGSFTLVLDVEDYKKTTPVGQAFSSSVVTITDSGSVDLENGLRILRTAPSGNYVGILDRYRGLAAIQLSSSVVDNVMLDGTATGEIEFFVSDGGTTYSFMDAAASASILQLADGLRHRIEKLEIENVAQLNTALYTVNAGAGDFNYSANPSYVNASGSVRVRLSNGSPQKSLPAYAYVTGVGLYGADDELLAVAKLSKPVKKSAAAPLLMGVKLTY